jgi:hypothetical protein
MRLQLTAVVGLAACGAMLGPARGDGTLSMRGVYYKERATRVMQPMLDAMFDVGAHGVATGHLLVDAITSASASAGADGAAFTERRYEGGLGYRHDLDGLTVAVDGKYSTESDYASWYLGVRAQLELAQKNTLLALGGGFSFDTISAGAAQGLAMPTLRCSAAEPSSPRCALHSYAVYGSVTQVLGPDAVLGVSVDLSTLDGYQSNPYRQAIVGEALVRERHPEERSRAAFAASLRYYVAPTATTVIGAYRYYRDSWQVHAHTPELRVVQELGPSADLGVRYRYYRQDGASFFRERYPADDGAMTQFVTDDAKLSDFTGHTLELKLGALGELIDLEDRWAGARVEAILEYVIQHNSFGNAVVAHAALTIPFTY